MEIDRDLRAKARRQRTVLRHARTKARFLALESLISGDFATFGLQLAAYKGFVEREKRLEEATRGLGWLGRLERRHGFGLREAHYYLGWLFLALSAVWFHPAAGLAVLGLGCLLPTRRRQSTRPESPVQDQRTRPAPRAEVPDSSRRAR